MKRIELLESQLKRLENSLDKWDENKLKEKEYSKWVRKSNIIFWKIKMVENKIEGMLIKENLKNSLDERGVKNG